MSDDCKCDHCGKRGRRRWGRLAPDDDDVLREVGMTLMLMELLGVSADAIRATALSRAREHLNT